MKPPAAVHLYGPFSVHVRCSGTTALAPSLAHNSFMLGVIVYNLIGAQLVLELDEVADSVQGGQLHV